MVSNFCTQIPLSFLFHVAAAPGVIRECNHLLVNTHLQRLTGRIVVQTVQFRAIFIFSNVNRVAGEESIVSVFQKACKLTVATILSLGSYIEGLLCGAVCFVIKCGSKPLICGSNDAQLLNNTFMWCCLFCDTVWF